MQKEKKKERKGSRPDVKEKANSRPSPSALPPLFFSFDFVRLPSFPAEERRGEDSSIIINQRHDELLISFPKGIILLLPLSPQSV